MLLFVLRLHPHFRLFSRLEIFKIVIKPHSSLFIHKSWTKGYFGYNPQQMHTHTHTPSPSDAVAHPNSHTWKAYRLERSESTSSPAYLDPSVFCKRFQLYFNGICDYVSLSFICLSLKIEITLVICVHVWGVKCWLVYTKVAWCGDNYIARGGFFLFPVQWIWSKHTSLSLSLSLSLDRKSVV